MDEVRHSLAQQVLLRDAEQLAGSEIRIDVPALVVGDQDGVRRVLEDGAIIHDCAIAWPW